MKTRGSGVTVLPPHEQAIPGARTGACVEGARLAPVDVKIPTRLLTTEILGANKRMNAGDSPSFRAPGLLANLRWAACYFGVTDHQVVPNEVQLPGFEFQARSRRNRFGSTFV